MRSVGSVSQLVCGGHNCPNLWMNFRRVQLFAKFRFIGEVSTAVLLPRGVQELINESLKCEMAVEHRHLEFIHSFYALN